MMDRLIAIMRNYKTALFDAILIKIDIDLIHTIANKPFEKDFRLLIMVGICHQKEMFSFY